MIVTRTPTRLSFAGGGTDIPYFYKKHGGYFISAAIEKYMYITFNKIFQDHIRLTYSKVETVNSFNDIEHPLIKESIKLLKINNNIEITSMTEVPSRAGLGSSGSFLVGLLNAVHSFKNEKVGKEKLAEEAFNIEVEILKEPVGKQDQYIAAFGGITAFEIEKNGRVKVERLNLTSNTMDELKKNILVFYTGIQRKAGDILKNQVKLLSNSKDINTKNLLKYKNEAISLRDQLKSGNVDFLGEILRDYWERKKNMASSISNNIIDKWYGVAIKNGAVGGKLIGAGGGGFLMFYCNKNREKLRKSMKKEGLKELDYNFEFEGTKVIFNG
jgi:D-glycero-alpha-D-manno-heptose-7-phosphate kinase